MPRRGEPISKERLVEELNRFIRKGELWIDNGEFMEVTEAVIDSDGQVAIVQSNM